MIAPELVDKAFDEIKISGELMEDALDMAMVTALRVVLLGYNKSDQLLILAGDKNSKLGWIFTLSKEDGVLLGELTYSSNSFFDAYQQFCNLGEILPLAEYLKSKCDF